MDILESKISSSFSYLIAAFWMILFRLFHTYVSLSNLKDTYAYESYRTSLYISVCSWIICSVSIFFNIFSNEENKRVFYIPLVMILIFINCISVMYMVTELLESYGNSKLSDNQKELLFTALKIDFLTIIFLIIVLNIVFI